jgi:2'-5' RNA ligase
MEQVGQGLRWAQAYGTQVPEPYQAAAALLASGRGLQPDEIETLAAMVADLDSPVPGWNAGEDGYPCRPRILSSLAGGNLLEAWSATVAGSWQQEVERESSALLASIGFSEDGPDPEYSYIGLCAAGDPDIVTDLVRIGRNGDHWRWNPAEPIWNRADASVIASHPGVEPDSAMLAAIVSALADGDKLCLVYGEPLMFLPDEMATTDFPDDVETSLTAAVVDDMDIRAVWGLVKIDPGPVVSLRAAGEWREMPGWPRDPMRIVVLDEWTSAAVAIKADALGEVPDIVVSDDVQTIPEQMSRGVLELADAAFAKAIASVSSAVPSDDAVAQVSNRQANRKLISELELVRDWTVLTSQRNLLAAALAPQVERTVVSAGGRNHPGAVRLRRYWTRGQGAMKIAWGAHGNWRRCYRQLFKYMGERAAGYCQKLHKSQTGVYTGSRAHRNQLVASANASANSGGMIALVPSEADLNRLVLDEDGAEPREELHVTLAFLGEASEWSPIQREKLSRLLKTTVEDAIRPDIDTEGGVEGKVFGFAHWNPDGDDPVWVLSVGGAELTWVHDVIWQSITDANDGADLQELPVQHSPWQSHLTLKYAKTLDMDPVVLAERVGSVTFTHIRLTFGSDVTDIPL